MEKIRRRLLFLVILITIGCSGEEINIEGFDQELWNNDEFGCSNKRSGMIEPILDSKEKLLGLSTSDLMDLLGKPDKTELYVRNQKFFHYFVTPGDQCIDSNNADSPSILTFRFNATGLVKEVTLYN